jgi:RNA polymerase sigma-70 factor (ECF subfamily)
MTGPFWDPSPDDLQPVPPQISHSMVAVGIFSNRYAFKSNMCPLLRTAYAYDSMSYDSLSPQDLVRHCFQSSDQEAWTEFMRRFHRLIAGVVSRTARRWGVFSTDAIEDLVQDVYVKLCTERQRMLRGRHASHPNAVYGYIKVMAANLVQDHFKARHALKRGSGRAGQSLATVETPARPDGHGGRERIERMVLLGQIDRILKGAGFSREEQVLFWLYYRQGFTATGITDSPGVKLTVKGVESLLLRMSRIVRENLEVSGRLRKAS